MIESKIILLVATCLTFLIIWMIFLGVTMAYGPSFSSQFFFVIARDRQNENVVVAPNSVRTALAWLYIGADGATAAEIKIEAQLMGNDKIEVANKYGNIKRQYENETFKIQMANRIFIDHEFEIKSNFEICSKKYFGNSIESLSFHESNEAAIRINDWTRNQTFTLTDDIINEKDLSKGTTSVVVNTNSFISKWEHAFDINLTHETTFSVNASYKPRIRMMFQEGEYLVGNFPEIGAKGIEVPLKTKNMSMLVLMPYGIRDLGTLEETLKQLNIPVLRRRMRIQKVHLYLPKFQIQLNLSIQAVLEELGMKSMFSQKANFNFLVDDFKPFSITDFRHYTFINVDEFGIGESPTKAISRNLPYLMDLDLHSDIFQVNRPFVFAIKDPTYVFYIGHVAVL